MGNRDWGIGRDKSRFSVSVFVFGSQESKRLHSAALAIPHSRFPIPGGSQRASGKRPNNNPPPSINSEINTAHLSVKR